MAHEGFLQQLNLKSSERLGPYKLLQEVGYGGLGRVFKAIDLRTNHIVAIKVLHQKYCNNKRFLGIFHRELLIMASLNNKHIVRYLDSHFEPPIYYVVTQFVDGWSGYRFLKRVRKVPPLVATSILMDMLQGIDHLHLHDIVHADLSAANYMIDVEGRVYVADFGLSGVENIDTYKNYLIGTPGHHAPEHLQDESITSQSDIYCAGILFYELLTGVKPVASAKDRHLVLARMRDIDFNKIKYKDLWMTFKLRKILKKMLAFKPSRRYKTTDQVMLALYQILKSYNIRYTRYSIKKYLFDSGLIRGPYVGKKQDIYRGM